MKRLVVLLLSLCLGAHLAAAAAPAKIAFVDTGNTGRSVAAEAIARSAIHDKHLAVSVIGRAVDLDPFDVSPEPNMASLLGQHGMDVAGHVAAQLDAQDVKHADLILTMTAKHKATVIAMFPDAASKTQTLAEYATGAQSDVVDAYGKPMDVYEQVYSQIEGYMPAVLDKLSGK